MSDNVRMPLE